MSAPEKKLSRRPNHRRIFGLCGLFLLVIVVLGWDLSRSPSKRIYLGQMLGISNTTIGLSAAEKRAFRNDGRRYLYGGSEPDEDFDITEFRLNPSQLHHGLGRERFPALIEPEFVPASAVDDWLEKTSPVLAVKIEEEVKIYPIDLLIRHEVVNDVVGGRPIFAAFCVLAELGAVYERRIDGRLYTFAVSGYTYADHDVWDGRNAFVLWDRETESLWWPPIGCAVSSHMIDTPMKVLDKELWAQTTWGEVKERYPQAVVLKPGQEFKRPADWPKYDQGLHNPPRTPGTTETIPSTAIAPRWSENKDF